MSDLIQSLVLGIIIAQLVVLHGKINAIRKERETP